MRPRSSASTNYYPEEERVLAQWGTTCAIKQRMHQRAARMYAKHSKNVTVTILVLQTLAGSLNLSQDVPAYMEPMVAALQLILAVLLAVTSYLKMEQRAESHRSSALQYGELNKRLSTLLARRSSERPPAVGMVDQTLQTIIQLDKNSPMLPERVCKREQKAHHFTERFASNALPEELNGVAEVAIYGVTNANSPIAKHNEGIVLEMTKDNAVITPEPSDEDEEDRDDMRSTGSVEHTADRK